MSGFGSKMIARSVHERPLQAQSCRSLGPLLALSRRRSRIAGMSAIHPLRTLAESVVLRPEAPMQKPKYEVSGTDDLGDVHTFATDDRERAEEIKAIMGEDLEDVALKETASE